ncbi:MAG: uracil-DNA glycosylase [Planctomycetota bacterium]|nr:uracil-DNA glycosylase [Planctomycetota bacterium]
MTEPRKVSDTSDPRTVLQSLAAGLRARLEGEGRAGLTAVGRATPEVSAPSTASGGREYPAAPAAGSDAAGSGEAGSQVVVAPPALTPDAIATTMKAELAAQAPAESRTLDLFEFGSVPEEDGFSRQDALARITAEVASCDRCRELAAGRTRTVPGQGNPYTKLVFVGEGPGEEEDRQGLAFVGRAGELLTKMIAAIGLTREQVFICNIVKCRPPGNRTPMPDESANCMPYLARQLEIIRPRVICALGGTAAKWLLQTSDGITRLRGRFYPYRGAQLMPTFHPAYVLRNYTPDTRKKVYDDLLMARAAMDAAV